MKRPREIPRTPDRDNRQQRNSVSTGLGGNVYRRAPQAGEQRFTVDQPGQKQGFKHRTVPAEPSGHGRDHGTPMGRVAGGRDYGRVTGGYSGGGTHGQVSPGGALGSYGRGSPGSGGYRSAPRISGGTPWVVVREVEGMVQASVVVAEGIQRRFPILVENPQQYCPSEID